MRRTYSLWSSTKSSIENFSLYDKDILELYTLILPIQNHKTTKRALNGYFISWSVKYTYPTMANTPTLHVPNYYHVTARERTSHEENWNKISKSKIYWEGSYFGHFINLMTSWRHNDVINDKSNFPDCVIRCHGHTVKISSLNGEYIKSYWKCCFRGGSKLTPRKFKNFSTSIASDQAKEPEFLVRFFIFMLP